MKTPPSRLILALYASVLLALLAAPANAGSVGFLNADGVRIAGGTDPNIDTLTEAQAIYSTWLSAGKPVTGPLSGGYVVDAAGSSLISKVDFTGTTGNDFSGGLAFPGSVLNNGTKDFLVSVNGFVKLSAGAYTINVESNDGFSLKMNLLSGDAITFAKFGGGFNQGLSNELRFESTTGNTNTRGNFTLNQDSVFSIALIVYDAGGGSFLEVSIRDGLSTLAPSSSNLNGYEILTHNGLGGKVKIGTELSDVSNVPESGGILQLLSIGVFGILAGSLFQRRK